MKKNKIGLGAVLVLCLTLTATVLQAEGTRGKGLPADAIPKELRGQVIKNRFIPASEKKVGVIHALVGNVVVVHRATGEAYFAMEGDTIYENDSLTTLAKSRCRIKFLHEDVVTMAPETRFSVDQFQDERKIGRKRSFFSLLKGKAMFYALRLFRYKDVRFRLKTPTVTVGVRGTKFGVHVYQEEESRRSDAGLKIAARGNDMGLYLAQGPGTGKSVTEVAAEDPGTFVELPDGTQVPVPPGTFGQFVEGEPPVVQPDPEGRKLNEIEEDSEVRTEEQRAAEKEAEETKKAAAEVEEGIAADEGEEPAEESSGQLADKSSEENQREVATKTEKENLDAAAPSSQAAAENPQATQQGFFAAMVTETSGPDIEDIFVSTSRQDFNSASVQAFGVFNSSSVIEGGGGPTVSDKPLLKGFSNAEDSIGTGDLGTSNPITEVVLGTNAFQEWGHWIVPNSFTATGQVSETYTIDNKGYFIFGQTTPDAAVAGFSGTASYSGEAFGTFWSSSGGTDMTGTFSTSVNFDASTDQISNFNMSVFGPGKSASITGATATFSSSQFTVNTSSGSWELFDGSTLFKSTTTGQVDFRRATGSLFGPNGEKIGGAWGMKHDSVTGAQGIFRGDKQ